MGGKEGCKGRLKPLLYLTFSTYLVRGNIFIRDLKSDVCANNSRGISLSDDVRAIMCPRFISGITYTIKTTCTRKRVLFVTESIAYFCDIAAIFGIQSLDSS